MRVLVILACAVSAAVLPAAAAPMARLQYLTGPWNCTYRAGAARLAYHATYAYDRDGRTLRETTSWPGGGDEELLAYGAHRGWTAVVFEDQGSVTILHGTGSDPDHIAYRSVYPDASIAERFDRISAREYTLRATVLSGGKTIRSVDTCLRAAR